MPGVCIVIAVVPVAESGFVETKCPSASKMRTLPPCVLESVTVIPFTARLKVFCGAAITKFDFSDELLFAFDDEDFAEEDDLASLEEDSCFTEELLDTTLDELCSSEELEGGATELEDFSELLLEICDELDSTDDDEIDEDDSVLELLDCELLEKPYWE